MKKSILTLALGLVLASSMNLGLAQAACEVNDNGKTSPFDGKSLDGAQVEKKSLVPLNKEFAALNVVEKAFKGEVQTCSGCTGKFITCN